MTLETSRFFPPEIIREILLKATVKSLLRCKCVCKEWYSLISDQHFIKSHYTLSSTNNINFNHHRLICNRYEYHCYAYHRQLALYSCPLYDVLFDKSANNAIKLKNPLQRTRSQSVRIVGSCNGLVCLLADDENTLFIYNPSTRRTNILPGCKQGAVLSFRVSYGFGYDETTHDYKVVKIWRCDRPGAMIYSLKAGSWKEIGLFPCASFFNDGKFLNGALHWASKAYSGSGDIVSLDLGKESYGVVLEPEYDVEGDKICHLGVWGEWLCVLYNYTQRNVVDVWVMKVYGVKDSWTKLVCIPYPDIWRGQILDPLCISNDGKVLLQFGLRLLVYDSKDGSSTMIDNFDRCRHACIVAESLVSPFPALGLADRGEHRAEANPSRPETDPSQKENPGKPKPNPEPKLLGFTRFGSGRVGFGRFSRFWLCFLGFRAKPNRTDPSRNRNPGKPKPSTEPSMFGSVSGQSVSVGFTWFSGFGRFCSALLADNNGDEN